MIGRARIGLWLVLAAFSLTLVPSASGQDGNSEPIQEEQTAGSVIEPVIADPIVTDSVVAEYLPPELVEGGFAGLAYWQWLAILLTIFVGMAVDFTVRMLLKGVWIRMTARKGKKPVEKEELKRAVRPFGLAAAAGVWLLGIQVLDLPDVASQVLVVAVRLFLTFSAVWAAYRVTDLVAAFTMARAARSQTKIDDLLVPLLRKTIKVFIAALGAVYVADSLRIPIMPMLTGLGVGSLAFAFAAKDTIENFFGSVAVILDRPFEVGDWVVVGDVEGTVEELGLRSTRIRTFYNSLITVPNATLVRAQVDNYGRRKYRRFRTHINVTYDTTPEKIESFCEGIREIVRQHPYTRKDYYHVWLNSFGAHSLDILLYVFHECPDWATELRERHRLMIDIIRLAEKIGVEFAFPTQKLHLVQESGESRQAGEPPAHDDLRKMVEGRRAARSITEGARWQRETPGPVLFDGDDPLAKVETEASDSAVKIDQTEKKL